MLGAKGDLVTVDGSITPLEAYGIKVMSLGFMLEEGTPVIWRGPMIAGALKQLLNDVEWGELDYMVLDLPPGTGDASLTLAQMIPLSGALIVSTPQDIALLDARKGLNMFRKVDVPVLGFIENMSYYVCPKCGDRADIFGHGGARQASLNLNYPFLGEIPLSSVIRKRSDSGEPIALDADSKYGQYFHEIAIHIAREVAVINRETPSSELSIEI